MKTILVLFFGLFFFNFSFAQSSIPFDLYMSSLKKCQKKESGRVQIKNYGGDEATLMWDAKEKSILVFWFKNNTHFYREITPSNYVLQDVLNKDGYLFDVRIFQSEADERGVAIGNIYSAIKAAGCPID